MKHHVMLFTLLLSIYTTHIRARSLQLNPLARIENVTAELQSLRDLPRCEKDSECKDSCSCQDFQVAKLCGSKLGAAFNVLRCESCDSNADCPAGDECVSSRCLSCFAGSLRKSNANCQIGAPPCIETQWLRSRGLSQYALRHTGEAHVLCLPGLPCGTHGHLLRECTADGECALTTYRKLCARRADCTQSVKQVSQLNHYHDWSAHYIHHESTKVILTSLSAHPDASKLTPSMLVAYATDLLNQYGLGRVSNAVAMVPTNFRLGMQAARVHIAGAASSSGATCSGY